MNQGSEYNDIYRKDYSYPLKGGRRMKGIIKYGDRIWYGFKNGTPQKYIDLKVVKTNTIMLLMTVALFGVLYLAKG